MVKDQNVKSKQTAGAERQDSTLCEGKEFQPDISQTPCHWPSRFSHWLLTCSQGFLSLASVRAIRFRMQMIYADYAAQAQE